MWHFPAVVTQIETQVCSQKIYLKKNYCNSWVYMIVSSNTTADCYSSSSLILEWMNRARLLPSGGLFDCSKCQPSRDNMLYQWTFPRHLIKRLCFGNSVFILLLIGCFNSLAFRQNRVNRQIMMRLVKHNPNIFRTDLNSCCGCAWFYRKVLLHNISTSWEKLFVVWMICITIHGMIQLLICAPCFNFPEVIWALIINGRFKRKKK